MTVYDWTNIAIAQRYSDIAEYLDMICEWFHLRPMPMDMDMIHLVDKNSTVGSNGWFGGSVPFNDGRGLVV
jgi:hypothetical protein